MENNNDDNNDEHNDDDADNNDNDDDDDKSLKQISILGTNNRYQMKKVMKKEKVIKKRLESENWSFSSDYFSYEKQIYLLDCIYNNNFKEEIQPIIKIMIQQIHQKITGYKQQDLLKTHFLKEKFITFENIVKKLFDCQLKCYYCINEMTILYDITREMKQWTVDRIDNDFGHNIDNYHLSCLDCNLKRRKRTDEKFRFTKQLQLIKQEE
jgi:hypothetical protein